MGGDVDAAEALVAGLAAVQRACLRSGSDYDEHIDAARAAGCEEAVAFFERLKAEDLERVWRAHALLGGLAVPVRRGSTLAGGGRTGG